MDSGVLASLDMNCHHKIIYANFDLQAYSLPPSAKSYAHNYANADYIRKATRGLNEEEYFANKDVNEMANIFNKTIHNILNNYIPHYTIICDDQDPP